MLSVHYCCFDELNGERLNYPHGITISDHVWLCANCKILKGCKIAGDIVVGNSSVVTKDLVMENSIYAGNPAKLLRRGIKWKREVV